MRDFLSDYWFDESRHLFFFLSSKKVLLACAFFFFCVYAFVRVTLFCGSCVLMDRSLRFQCFNALLVLHCLLSFSYCPQRSPFLGMSVFEGDFLRYYRSIKQRFYRGVDVTWNFRRLFFFLIQIRYQT